MVRAVGHVTAFASGVVTDEHRPKCVDCDRMLKAHTEGRHYCPCCGEIYIRVEALIGLRVADSHGWTRTASAVGRTPNHEYFMSGPHACPKPKKSTKADSPRLFEGAG